MKHQKHLTAAVLAIATVVGLAIGAYASPSSQAATAVGTPEAAAQASLPQWMESIRGNYAVYGFQSADELNVVTLGEPYQVYVLEPQALQSYAPGQKLEFIAKAAEEWQFPVLANGEPRGALTVALFEGKWQGVEYGRFDFGKRITQMTKHLAVVKGSVKLVMFAQTLSTFAVIERGNEERLIHLGSGGGVLTDVDRDDFKEYKTDELMPKLKDAYVKIKKAQDEAEQQQSSQQP